MSDFPNDDQFFEGDTSISTEDSLKEPDMFVVILHNDHYTTMDFVVEVLRAVFHKPVIEATKIMMDVHKKGKGIVGTYSYDIARTKVAQVIQMARANQFPLRCTMEKAT
ncbi:MAG TPA: ATP-dependent Clp protease adaptor ClpS [Spirochaetia bacterium]|jgi:ATP-dependent Clp protease adaptor protein ClpS|nr:ATP-dependent Clp protease adaptor ClpS [Spirochaetia bacterium]